MSGERFPMFGKRHSDESEQKMNLARGSPDTKLRMSAAQQVENNPMYGKKHSVETKRRLSASMQGANNPMYGRRA